MRNENQHTMLYFAFKTVIIFWYHLHANNLKPSKTVLRLSRFSSHLAICFDLRVTFQRLNHEILPGPSALLCRIICSGR